jgi:hypothetical protein
VPTRADYQSATDLQLPYSLVGISTACLGVTTWRRHSCLPGCPLGRALLPTLRLRYFVTTKKRVEMSLDTAGTSARATSAGGV